MFNYLMLVVCMLILLIASLTDNVNSVQLILLVVCSFLGIIIALSRE